MCCLHTLTVIVINFDFALISPQQVDLILLEGMGRAIHTNLYARFSVDCLKIAVIKNSWLACRLGGDLFSVIFQYEQYSNELPSNIMHGSSSAV